MGDAAHASTPHQGAGAGQCLEDASMLSHLLALIDDPSKLEAVFDIYSSLLQPRGEGIVRTSDEAGLLYMMSSPVYGKDIHGAMENAKRRFVWIWEHDLSADLELAEDRLRAGSR